MDDYIPESITREIIFNEIIVNKNEIKKLAKKLSLKEDKLWRIVQTFDIDITYERVKYHHIPTLEILDDLGIVDGRRCFLCKCTFCGNDKVICLGTRLIKGQKCCGCAKGRKIRKWNGYGEITGYFFSKIKCGAISRNLEFDITIESIWDLFLKQNRKCALTGMELKFAKITNQSEYQTASLDRIDSKKGYISSNIQWVHKHINLMKLDLKQSEFLEYCAMIYEYKIKGIDWRFEF